MISRKPERFQLRFLLFILCEMNKNGEISRKRTVKKFSGKERVKKVLIF